MRSISTFALLLITQERGCADVSHCIADANAVQPVSENGSLSLEHASPV